MNSKSLNPFQYVKCKTYSDRSSDPSTPRALLTSTCGAYKIMSNEFISSELSSSAEIVDYLTSKSVHTEITCICYKKCEFMDSSKISSKMYILKWSNAVNTDVPWKTRIALLEKEKYTLRRSSDNTSIVFYNISDRSKFVVSGFENKASFDWVCNLEEEEVPGATSACNPGTYNKDLITKPLAIMQGAHNSLYFTETNSIDLHNICKAYATFIKSAQSDFSYQTKLTQRYEALALSTAHSGKYWQNVQTDPFCNENFEIEKNPMEHSIYWALWDEPGALLDLYRIAVFTGHPHFQWNDSDLHILNLNLVCQYIFPFLRAFPTTAEIRKSQGGLRKYYVLLQQMACLICNKLLQRDVFFEINSEVHCLDNSDVNSRIPWLDTALSYKKIVAEKPTIAYKYEFEMRLPALPAVN